MSLRTNATPRALPVRMSSQSSDCFGIARAEDTPS
jgi:hypothetical protein